MAVLHTETTDNSEDVPKEALDKLPKKAAAAPEPMVPFFRLFSMADKYDYLLMLLGIIGALGHGMAKPLLVIFFARLLDAAGSFGSGVSGDAIRDNVSENAIYFVYVAVSTWILAWLEVACWIQTGERQSARLRVEYLKSLLRQDVEYFDTVINTGYFIDSLAADPLVVQNAVSEKMGSFIQHLATFFTGFAIGFSHEWRVSLVTLAVVPLIATGVGINTWNLTGITAKTTAAYSEAGRLAGEVVRLAAPLVSLLYVWSGHNKFHSLKGAWDTN